GTVEALIDLLGGDDEGLRADALWALHEITGQSLAAEAPAWRAYWQAERARANRELPVVLLELQSADPPLVIAAMRELGGFPAGRERIRASLRPLAASRQKEVRAAAFAVLGELRDRSAVPALVAALDDPDPEVWETAWNALKRITGKKLPPSAAAWRGSR